MKLDALQAKFNELVTALFDSEEDGNASDEDEENVVLEMQESPEKEKETTD